MPQDARTLLMFAILGTMATVAADAIAAQATLKPNDLARVRRRLAVHVAIGMAAALVAVAVIRIVLQALS